jgi:Domain of unknown function (DUF5655)
MVSAHLAGSAEHARQPPPLAALHPARSDPSHRSEAPAVTRARPPLWTCPACGAKLVARNMSHSCGRATLSDWEARMGPRARALYERFVELVASCGPYDVAPAKTRIAFLARVRFANVTSLSEKGMSCTFALPEPLAGPRFAKVAEVVPGWWVHRLRITDPAELDDEVRAWLRESYRRMGMQERLDERERSATMRAGGAR